jgi:hypothetical protein
MNNQQEQNLQERRRTLEIEAKKIYQWAESANLLRLGPPIITLTEGDFYPTIFSAQNSSLFTKPITAIGINPNRNPEEGGTIFIYTQDRLTKLSQEELTRQYLGKSKIEFKVIKPFRVSPGTPSASLAHRPKRHKGYIPCGSSISLAVMRDAGTLGCLVRRKGEIYGLSANHVTGGCSNALFGSPILFPGILDVGPGVEDPTTIGHHFACLPMVPGNPQPIGPTNPTSNYDAAIFTLGDANKMSSSQGGFFDTPTLTETTIDIEDVEVEKVGRTTGYTQGFVESTLIMPQPLRYQLKVFVSANEIVSFEGIVYYSPSYVLRTESGFFAREGDSGAIVVSKPNSSVGRKALGLLIGGEGENALMLPLDPILKAFDATLVSNHNV